MPRSTLRPVLLLILAAASLAGGRGTSLKQEMKFGVEAAQQGLWHEAIFRWEKYLKDHPDSARLRSNLAVAYESLGDLEQAEAQYKEARRLEPDNKEIRDNYTAFQDLYKSLRQRRVSAPSAGDAAPAASPAGGQESPAPPSAAPPAPGPSPQSPPAPTPAPDAP
jgi:Flp pilus assembly protein TadD